jgi:hypothetical protein
MLLTTEDLWQPVLYETGSRKTSPMARFWLQSIQWLAHQDQKVSKDAPLVMAMTDRSYYEPGDPVRFTVFLRDSDATMENNLRVQPVDQPEAPVEEWIKLQNLAFSKPDDNGELEAVWTSNEPGNYALVLKAETEDDNAAVTCRFSVGRPHEEMARTSLDEDLLRRIANATQGGYYTPLTVRDLPLSVERNPMIQSRLVEKDILDSPVLPAAFLLVMSAAWTIRRRRNLI